MFIKSIRWRMLLWLAFLLIFILSGFGITAYQLHRTNLLRQIDEELDRRVAALGSDVRGLPPLGQRAGRPPFEPDRMPDLGAFEGGPPPGKRPFEPEREFPGPRRRGPDSKGPRGWFDELFEGREIRLSSQTASLFDQAGTNGFYYAVWSRGGILQKNSTNAPSNLSPPPRADTVAVIQRRMGNASREAFQFTGMGDCILVGRPIAGDLKDLRRFAWLLVAAGGAVLFLGLGGGWLLASHALRPVEEISAAAGRISAGNLAERISVADTDSELGRLAGVLNSTFARLESAFAQQKQFTADASHELRTPLAVLISEAQTTLARDRNAAEYRETIEVCLDAAQQMKRLTQSLLELARFDAGQETLERAPVDLADRVAACVELVEPLGRPRGIKIKCDLQPVTVDGDGDRLGQVITNLLVNAIQYNKDQGEISIGTRLDKDTVVLTITDTGPGIAADDLPHIFERFFRADKSRARAQGRYGLGLAICKAIVEAHGGSIEAASPPGAGTTFTVRLPR